MSWAPPLARRGVCRRRVGEIRCVRARVVASVYQSSTMAALDSMKDFVWVEFVACNRVVNQFINNTTPRAIFCAHDIHIQCTTYKHLSSSAGRPAGRPVRAEPSRVKRQSASTARSASRCADHNRSCAHVRSSEEYHESKKLERKPALPQFSRRGNILTR